MPRNYQQLTRPPDGVIVPRWLFWTVVFLFAAYVAYKTFEPPSWTIQRLESPDGHRTAVLLRTQFTHQHFAVKIKDGPIWTTAYLSPSITNSFREDLGERLAWSTNSETLYFRLGSHIVWHRDFR